jgi:CheY-like chemotaxis protein
VELRNIEIDPEAKILEHDPSLRPGPYMRLAVKDTGHGMPPHVANRIFEPYFTTKEKGVGTGLGLAMVHGITKNCGGTVYLKSKVGKGAAFYVFLPRTDSDRSESEKEEKPGDRKHITGNERVLFVDDEEDIVFIGREMLERLGYQVVAKKNGIEALEEFKKAPHQFDVVVTDMTMPKMTGEKFARKLIQIRPDIPVILCTGFSEQINEKKAKQVGIRAFMMKPLTINQLAETLRAVIEGRT